MAIIYEQAKYINPANYPDMQVLNPRQRHANWVQEVKKASSYVKEGAMLYLPEAETDQVTDILTDAAKRGIPTELHVDAITWLLQGGKTRLFPRSPFSKTENTPWTKRLNQYFTPFQNAGGELMVHNPAQSVLIKMFPWMQRDHRKGGVVDGKVGDWKDYNYGENSWDMLCYALSTTHPPTVEVLEKQFEYSRFLTPEGKYIDNRPGGDLIVDIPGQPYRFLMDRGDPGRSVMLQRALSIAKYPGPAIFASQYPASGRIANAIVKRSQEGYPTVFITSDENHSQNINKFSPRKLAALKWEATSEGNQLINTVYHHGKVHSKAFLVWTPDGVLGIVGSNNFNEVGILAGTAENGFEFIQDSPVSRNLFDRHLLDIRLQDGHPRPFANTRYEEVFSPQNDKRHFNQSGVII